MKAPNPPIRLFNLPRSFNPLRRARSLSRRTALACALLACALSVLPLNGVAAAAGGKGARKAALKVAQAKPKVAQAKPSPVGDAAGAATKKPVGIVIEGQEVYPYPSDGGLKKYALVVKKKESDFQFDGDPRLISLSLTPAGAADITIRRVTPTRIEADFWAPDKFEVKDVSVTAYDRDNPRLVVASTDIEVKENAGDNSTGMTAAARKTAAKANGEADADQPQIDSTAIVFLQRAYGIGRLKIE